MRQSPCESFPERKPNRIKEYDYSGAGAYFVTICTEGRQCILSVIEGENISEEISPDTVGETIGLPSIWPKLSKIGNVADDALNNISAIYPNVTVDYYVIMPNHIHLILQIHADEYGRPMVSPTVNRIIQQFKGIVTKRIGKAIWQRSFYDHIIRNSEDYKETSKYIYENPARWFYDELYTET